MKMRCEVCRSCRSANPCPDNLTIISGTSERTQKLNLDARRLRLRDQTSVRTAQRSNIKIL
jgi:hypothetical protein